MTIGEVIARLERRNGGRLSIIVNGRRLADISDLRDIPPEALAQVEILANTSAGRYGFSPQDKVLNLVLKPHFESTNMDGGLRLPTESGSISASTALRYVNIRGERRFNASTSLARTTALDARERLDLLEAGGGDVLTPYRTLLPSSRSTTLTSGLALPRGSTSISLSGLINDVASHQLSRFYLADARLGENGSEESIGVRAIIDASYSRIYQIGASASGTANRLNWTAELTGSIATSKASSHPSKRHAITLPAATPSVILPSQYIPVFTTSDSANLSFASSVNVPVISLPAGEVNVNTRFTTSAQRLVTIDKTVEASKRSYTQTRSRAHAGLYIPIVGPELPVVGALGRLALSVNGDYERVGGSTDYPGYDVAFDWQPVDAFSLSLGKSMTKSVPGLAGNRDPIIYTPGTLVADAVAGGYVLVTRISGGMRDLKDVSQVDTSARLTFSKSFGSTNVSATLDYSSASINNPLVSVSYPNAFFQRAFPDRFVRDASGILRSIDVRPFNASSQKRQVLKPNAHISGYAGGGNSAAIKAENRGVEWDISVSYEWTLRDVLRPSDSQAGVDLLKTPFDGVQGTSRHRINIEASTTRRNVNFQLTTRWRSGVRVEDVAAINRYSIDFSPIWTTNAEVSVTIPQAGKSSDIPKSLRIWLSVENLLNRRLSVHDSNGQVPTAFQPAFLDPIGRVIAFKASRGL